MLSVEEYASRAGISPRSARLRIASGTLDARKVGGRWVIEHADAKIAHRPGRRLSARSFDLLAAYVDGSMDHMSSDERRRARERAHRIRSLGVSQVKLFAERPDMVVTRFHASDADLAELQSDARLTFTGISHPDADVYGPVVDAYVSPDDREDIELFHMLETADSRSSNVTLREHVPRPRVCRLHVIADLLDDESPRSRAEASRLLAILESET